MIVGLIYFPYYVWKSSATWLKRSHQPRVFKRFEGFFDEFKQENLYCLRYDIVFIIRRYTIVLTCVCTGFNALANLQFWYFIQINMQLWSTGIVLSYIAWHTPYIKNVINFQEVVNEVCVLCCTYMLFCFTEWVNNTERYLMGDVMKYILIFNVTFNFIVLLSA